LFRIAQDARPRLFEKAVPPFKNLLLQAMMDAERRQQIKGGMQMLVVVPLDELGDESLGVLRGSFVQKHFAHEDVKEPNGVTSPINGIEKFG
jgi:hypothetical protein